MAKRSRHAAGTRSTAESLIDWHEPERNAHVLDWRERAHDFGLVPIDEDGAVLGALVKPPDSIIREQEPEAFDDQPVDDGEREALAPEEIEEAPDARVPQEEPDLVRVYLRNIGQRKLLKAHQEQEIGRKIELARGELLAALAAMPPARSTLLSLADCVTREEAPAAELILLPDGGELKPEKVAPV